MTVIFQRNDLSLENAAGALRAICQSKDLRGYSPLCYSGRRQYLEHGPSPFVSDIFSNGPFIRTDFSYVSANLAKDAVKNFEWNRTFNEKRKAMGRRSKKKEEEFSKNWNEEIDALISESFLTFGDIAPSLDAILSKVDVLGLQKASISLYSDPRKAETCDLITSASVRVEKQPNGKYTLVLAGSKNVEAEPLGSLDVLKRYFGDSKSI